MKRITITDNRTIASVQQEFHELFPYLKLEFFSKLHEPGQPSHLKFMQQPGKTLGEIRSGHASGEIVITPQMTVSELEQAFGQRYGLGVQVFRKSGKSWLETILTDNWSLHKQNAEGEYLDTPLPPDEPMDYHEQE